MKLFYWFSVVTLLYCVALSIHHIEIAVVSYVDNTYDLGVAPGTEEN